MKLTMTNKPMVREFTLFAPISELREAVVKNNSIFVDIVYHTKTRLSLSIQGGSATFKVNHHSKYSTDNNLNLHEETGMNFFSGQRSTNLYFKLTKKQNVEVLKEHILSLVDGLFDSLGIRELVDTGNFEITCYTPKDLLS